MGEFHSMCLARVQSLAAGFEIAALVLCCMLAAMEVTQAGGAGDNSHSAPACWAPEDLFARRGEGEVRPGLTGSAAPPKAELVDFPPILPNMRGSIRRVRLPPENKLVALTFDLCESAYETGGYQGDIVDILRANNVKATFFVGGKWLASHPERAQQLMSDPRFELGNHTWAHRNLRLLSGLDLTEEVKGAQLAYDRLRLDLKSKKCVGPGDGKYAHESSPKRLGLFRFPFGACDAKSLAEVGELGLLAIQWDVSSDDADLQQIPDRMIKKVLDEIRPGSIVLFHANGRGWYTDDALPWIISALKASGYKFATVTQLLEAGEPVISPSCYDRHVGDTDQYDELARHLEEQ